MSTPRAAVSRKNSGDATRTFEGYAGYTVCDPRGQKIGQAENLFLNGGGEPEYTSVKMGRLRPRTILIPVQMVATDEKRRTLTLQ